MTSRHGRVTIAGRVVQPLTTPVETIVVRRRVTCRNWKVVKRFEPRTDGSFRVHLRTPKDGEAAVYRMTTRVKLFAWFARTSDVPAAAVRGSSVDLVKWASLTGRAGDNRAGCAVVERPH